MRLLAAAQVGGAAPLLRRCRNGAARHKSSGSAHISCFDLFSIGIGPSSSHTVGPMRAGAKFAQILEQQGMLRSTKSVVVKVYGSLALTGFGHGTFTAIQLGLEGSLPASVDIDTMPARLEAIRSERTLLLNGSHRIVFDPRTDIEIRGDELLPYHTNGMSFAALGDPAAPPLFEETYYSIGGGFFVDHDGVKQDDSRAKVGRVSSGEAPRAAPFPFANAAELFALCEREGTTVAQLARRNELSERSEEELDRYLAAIWTTMDACIERGMRASGPLEEGGAVVRRASMDRNWLKRAGAAAEKSDWVVAWAMAVNEENAAGGRVVTAPTNGAAGILPAVCKYYSEFVPGANANGLAEMLLTASVIGGLFKKGASISGAEVGCQGEVGVACSMAAGSLAAALGGSLRQVEMAAEIAMEHNLGLTCDPVDGKVQIPCIERNGLGATRAVDAARLAMRSEHQRVISLDTVIEVMWKTGQDMKPKYKETSLGGLAKLAQNATFC